MCAVMSRRMPSSRSGSPVSVRKKVTAISHQMLGAVSGVERDFERLPKLLAGAMSRQSAKHVLGGRGEGSGTLRYSGVSAMHSSTLKPNSRLTDGLMYSNRQPCIAFSIQRRGSPSSDNPPAAPGGVQRADQTTSSTLSVISR